MAETTICPTCKGTVLSVRMRNGRGGFRLVAIELCAEGRGDVALLPSLFPEQGSAPLAELVSNGTSYREHRRCRVPSFTGQAPARKPRPGVEAVIEYFRGGAKLK